jgi:hypothetical protein
VSHIGVFVRCNAAAAAAAAAAVAERSIYPTLAGWHLVCPLTVLTPRVTLTALTRVCLHNNTTCAYAPSGNAQILTCSHPLSSVVLEQPQDAIHHAVMQPEQWVKASVQHGTAGHNSSSSSSGSSSTILEPWKQGAVAACRAATAAQQNTKPAANPVCCAVVAATAGRQCVIVHS